MANVIRVESRLLYSDPDVFGPYAINTWHVSYGGLGGGTAAGAADTTQAAIQAFFNSRNDDDQSVSDFMPDSILTGVIQFRYWDLADTDPVAQDLDDGTLDHLQDDTPLPPQVAACVTTNCDPYGGHRRQSFYNRQYIGPLTYVALGAGGRLPTALQSVLVGDAGDTNSSGFLAYGGVLDNFGVDAYRPAVYSPTHDSSAIPDRVWVDNRWDIQRRRALNITSKYSFDIP